MAEAEVMTKEATPKKVMALASRKYSRDEKIQKDQEELEQLLAEQKGKSGERYILGGDNVTIYEIYAALANLTRGQKPQMKMGHGLAVLIGTTLELVSKLTQKEPLLTRYVGKK